MGVVKEIEYKDKKIIVIDVSQDGRTDYAKIIQSIEAAKKLIGSQPPKTALVLTNVANVHFNNDVIAALKKYVEHNSPHIRKSAVIGLDGLKKIVYNMIVKLTGRSMMTFDNEQDAMEWLVKEEIIKI